ncbi:hypothetical protein [Hymenobacter sp. BT559]|uniref:hypothetical protein n=1 Tax=Hymenobacter sp. BT559 TaxID=2795729 RepID=UPI0018EDDDE5|nr:hypothetical protein [Hymenobacter sp. BT559]MBJ6143996.1 hypothetical protein [Hymenobacter sp. BT559]
MLNKPASRASQLGRYLLAAPFMLALALGHSAAHAQVAPTPAPAQKPIPQDVVYYLDGQKADKSVLDKTKLDPETISYMQVLKGEQQQQIFGTSSAGGTVVVTTKANANSPAVLALNKRIAAVAPMVGPTPEQSAAIAAVQAYMTKNYPAAKMEMVAPAKNQPGRYHTIFEQDGKRMQLFFDGQGNPVKE